MRVSIRVALEQGWTGVSVPVERLERIAAMGFDGIELCFQAGPWQFKTAAFYSQEAVDQLMATCARLNLKIFSVSSDWAWVYASLFPTLKGWQGRGMELLSEDAQLAAKLGAEAMLIHFATSKGTWEECRDLCRQASAIGEATGVRLGYEASIWERLGFGKIESLVRMADEAGGTGFGAYLHNSYPRSGLPLEDEVRLGYPRLTNTMHSSVLVEMEGRTPAQINWDKAYPAIQKYLPNCIWTFEVGLDRVAESKKIIDAIIAKYEGK